MHFQIFYSRPFLLVVVLPSNCCTPKMRPNTFSLLNSSTLGIDWGKHGNTTLQMKMDADTRRWHLWDRLSKQRKSEWICLLGLPYPWHAVVTVRVSMLPIYVVHRRQGPRKMDLNSPKVKWWTHTRPELTDGQKQKIIDTGVSTTTTSKSQCGH